MITLIQLTGCSSPTTKEENVSTAIKPSLYESEARQIIVQEAINQIGKSYRLGGVSPKEGFDCSGLVFFTYLQAGKFLPRRSEDQFLSAQKIKKPKYGDLVFFSTNIKSKHIDHVGIYVGDEIFIHAPGKNKTVSASKLSEPYWQQRIKGIGSYFD